jgi:hypothetical protein
MTQPFIKHHEVTAELRETQHGTEIQLTQLDTCGEDAHVVDLHPWQLRAICDHFGITTADEQAAKTIAALQRRMRVLTARIGHLANYLATCSDHSHADLTYETGYATATSEIADEFVADFEQPAQQQATTTPQSAESSFISPSPILGFPSDRS